MKIVLDTNVFVSGIFWSGPPCKILKAWRDGRLQFVLSPEILDEYRRVLSELGMQHPNIDFQPFIDLATLEGEICHPTRLPHQVCRDPDDDKFIASALASGASVIVSGDKDLIDLSSYQGVKILKPRQFVSLYLEKKK